MILMNYRELARNFAEAFIQGKPEELLAEIAMTIPREEWSLCFDNWYQYDVVTGLFQSGITSKELMKLVAEVGYNLASNKPVKTKVRMTSGVPYLYSNVGDNTMLIDCQDELIGIYNSMLCTN